MPRKARIWYPGATYHITSRGIRKAPLFYDAEDRLKYLEFVEETRSRIPFTLHTYCLMTNHIHLQMETLHDSPSNIMKYLHSNYATYFNRKYQFSGHVFEGRYGSEIIKNAEYELEINRYIHLNPIRANMVSDLMGYTWSSYADYVGSRPKPLVSTERILSFFPDPKVENYIKFLNTKYIDLKFINQYQMIVFNDQSE
ncbi:transposase [Aquibacillus albus]|uniref:REP element-mobilizing transposase RayT n=1 Tax=Aquibacillus albus TaxID=1168171 RepID=A0ABS2MWD6_9BACI|nr:transposase [Aquibacillus albus]MBM7570015.1 REP element-mobilizing transposase RayT [Aquibacillus albus]